MPSCPLQIISAAVFVPLKPDPGPRCQFSSTRYPLQPHLMKGPIVKLEVTAFYCEGCRLPQAPVSANKSMAGIGTTLRQCSISDLKLGDRVACSYHLWRRDYRWLPLRAVEDPSEIIGGAGVTQEVHVTKIFCLSWLTHNEIRKRIYCREINLIFINNKPQYSIEDTTAAWRLRFRSSWRRTRLVSAKPRRYFIRLKMTSAFPTY